MAGGDDQRKKTVDLNATADTAPRALDPGVTIDPAGATSWSMQPAVKLDETIAPTGPHAFVEPHRGDLSATRLPDGERSQRRPLGDLDVTRDSLGRSGPSQGRVDPALPERLGRYMVIKQLGAGGMGVVYKAYDPDLDRKVALKLLLGQVTAQSRARLLREAQAMARLSHPNVVPVYDLGVVDEQVFVAMDFVDGETLSGWMEARHSWQEVVDLFIQAGRGLAAAHTVGLIHRDFKPDNVLLSRDASTGELKAQVADFGLARRDDDAPEILPRQQEELVMQSRHSLLDAGLTRIGAVIGTPAYMSPEQHMGVPADARTDQFSFCIALFEALYGERPFTGDTLDELAVAASSPRRAPPPAGNEVPKWLHRVCLRGLQPDREARYVDMDALLTELSRGRVEGRYKWFALAGMLALIGGVATVLLTRGEAGEQRCAGGPARLAGVWDAKVQRDAEKAFTATGLIYAGDAWKAARGQVDRYSEGWLTMYRDSCEATARGEQSAELMDLRTACMTGALQDLGALTRLYVGGDKQVVKRAVDAALALPALDACADVSALRAVGGVAAPEDAATVEAVRATLAEARTLRSAGKYKDSVALAAEAVERARALDYAPLIAEAKLTLGRGRLGSGEHEAAIAPLTEAVAGALASGDDSRVFDGFVSLHDVVGYNLGRYKEAAAWSELAGGALQKIGGKPREEARLMASRGLVAIAATQFPAAEAALLRALTLLEAEYGGDSPRLANVVNGLGAIYLRTGKYIEAETTFARALALAEAAGGPNHPDVAQPLNNLALSYERVGRIDEALAAVRRSKDIIAGTSGVDHPNVGIMRQNIGGMLRLLGRLPEARAELEAAVTLLEAKLGPEHPALGGALTMSGDVALSQGDLPRARGLYARADALRQKALGAEHPDRAYALLGLGKVALAEGKPAEALVSLELAAKLWKDSTTDPSDLGDLRFQLARALWDTDPARARGLTVEARASLTEAGINARSQLQALETWALAHP